MKLQTNNAFKPIIPIYSNLHVLLDGLSLHFYLQSGPNSNGPKFLFHFLLSGLNSIHF